MTHKPKRAKSHKGGRERKTAVGGDKAGHGLKTHTREGRGHVGGWDRESGAR